MKPLKLIRSWIFFRVIYRKFYFYLLISGFIEINKNIKLLTNQLPHY